MSDAHPTKDQCVPFGCHIGIWHSWAKWEVYAEGDVLVNHLLSGKSFVDGKTIHQKRHCLRCDAAQLRNVKS